MSAHIPRRTFLGSMVATLLASACSHDVRAEDDAVESSLADTKTRPIPRRRLGRTGVSVSMVGLGGWHASVPELEERESIRIIRTAIDRGIDFLDNCWDYHDGEAERRMGLALRHGYRRKSFLMSKIDGRTRKSAIGQLEQSLRRLRTDMIDLVQIHEVIRESDADRVFREGAIEALVAAKKAGKIRFIGFTGHKAPGIHLKMLEMADQYDFRFDTVQMPLNVMDAHFRSFEHHVLPVLLQKGIGVLGMKSTGNAEILKSGVVNALECLRYSMNLPISTLVTGCDSLAILEQAIHAATTFEPMTDAEVRELLSRTREAAMTGKYEVFKTTEELDGTTSHPWWLEKACIKEDCSR